MRSAFQQHRRYLSGDFLLSEQTQEYLQRISRQAELNAFVAVADQQAVAAAEALDRKRAAGQPLGRLAGLLIALKDNICVKDQPVTCASKILSGYHSPYHATVVEKILQEDGIILGKTNLDEFAMGSSTENSAFGPSRNPLDRRRVPGGSSGGSAAAVAADLCDLALGSDTGGSIRQPAAFCGIVGLKPTYGRVSRYGLVAFASSFDQIGPLSKNVQDAALLLQIIAGRDARDATSAPQEVPDYLAALEKTSAPPVVGVPRQFYEGGLDPEINAALQHLIERMKEAGCRIEAVDLPLTEYAIAAYYILATAEASSNLSRYDGIRYGLRAEDADDLESMYSKTRSAGFGREVKRRIMLGTYVLSAGYYDAYYKKGQQVRRLIQEEYLRAFRKVDVLLTPTTPGTAFRLGEKLNDPLQMYLSDIYTVTANLAGIPALSLPCGKSAAGLPIGAQLMAGFFREKTLLAAGRLVESLVTA